MEGIRFVTDEQGNKVGVLIDLAIHGELWEDFYDHLLMNERADEPEESLEVGSSESPRSATEALPTTEPVVIPHR